MTAVEHHTFCRICVAGCGVIVSTDGDTVTAIKGDRDNAFSDGYTCFKGRAIPALHHRPDRLNVPMMRRDGELVEVTWDELLDDLAGKLGRIIDEHGPEAVGFFTGSGGYFDSAGLFMATLLRNAIATPSNYSDMTIDVVSTMVVSELICGRPGMLAKPDFDHNRLVIIVGSNPVVSHGQTMIMTNPIVRLRELTARGELWVIDPRRTETARLANGHLTGRPGSDHAVFGYLVREVLREGADYAYLEDHSVGVDQLREAVEPYTLERAAEMTGIDAADLERLLDAVRRAEGKLAVLTGTGLSMADDANISNWFIWALQVITKAADHPGGVSFTPGFFTQWDRLPLPELPATGTRGPGPKSRPELSSWLGEYPCAAFSDEVESGNLRAMLVMGGNPTLLMPDFPRVEAAMEHLEVLLAADIVPSRTVELATHVWPCLGQMERADLTMVHDVMFPSVMCQYTPALVQPGENRKPMWWLLMQLGRRLGHDLLPGVDPDTATDDDILAISLTNARTGLEPLREAGVNGQPIVTEKEVFGWVHEKVLPDGRWRLAPPELVAQLPDVRVPAPLVLTPHRQPKHQNTALLHLGDRPDILMNPKDAADAGVGNGEEVVVTSPTGSVQGFIRVTDDIRVGALSIPHGWSDPCVNTLISDSDVDPLTGMPRQCGTPVTVTRAESRPMVEVGGSAS
jgi:anaerobic selenocysteine-containing dehydrogenase